MYIFFLPLMTVKTEKRKKERGGNSDTFLRCIFTQVIVVQYRRKRCVRCFTTSHALLTYRAYCLLLLLLPLYLCISLSCCSSATCILYNQWRSDGVAGRTRRHLLGAAEAKNAEIFFLNSRENSDCKFRMCLRARNTKRYSQRVPIVSYYVGY